MPQVRPGAAMKTRDTGDTLVVETGPTPAQTAKCVHCGYLGAPFPDEITRGVYQCEHCKKVSAITPPRLPPSNGQRFEPGPRGPCRCSEAAILDRVTGLCPQCWRCWVYR
jgi:hypothetical protein